MKNCISITLLITSLFAFSQTKNCNGYLPTEKGQKLVYNQYDGNNNIHGYVISEVTEINTLSDQTISKVKQTFQDKNKQETKIGNTEYKCKDGSVFLSIRSMLPHEVLNSIEGMQGITIELHADEMEIPANSKKGDQLKDVKITITAKSNGIPMMTFNAAITNIICKGHEKLTTATGLYNCLKITSNTVIDSGYMKTTARSTLWFAKDIGLLQIHNLDEQGKPVSSMVLNKLY